MISMSVLHANAGDASAMKAVITPISVRILLNISVLLVLE